MFDIDPPEQNTKNNTAQTGGAEPGSTENTAAPAPGFEVPTLGPNIKPEEAVFYEGGFELPLYGATGYAAVVTDIYDDNFNVSLAVLNPGEAFLILRENGQWWQVGGGGVIGWVRHNHCMINLPDVIPSITYNNTNAYSSVFRANDVSIPNVTGEKLYSYSDRRDGKAWNERLARYEYIVPILYATAKRVYQAQLNALANSDTIVIYEAFRPRAVQEKVYAEVSALANSNAEVRRGFGTWNMSWFIAGSLSNHQIGYALDASLAKVISADYIVAGKYKYQKLDIFEYYMPSPIHELSTQGIVYTTPNGSKLAESMQNSASALKLQKYFVDAGFSPLPSEWWHFNDEDANANLTKRSDGRYEITVCLSVAPN
jgi:D-alanyl-D-alanine dipeptidase